MMSIVQLVLLPYILCIYLLLVLAKPLYRILKWTGFIWVFLYIAVIIYINFFTDIKPDTPVPDYFNLGYTNVEDYAYLGLYITFGISCIIFLYRVIKAIVLFIRDAI